MRTAKTDPMSNERRSLLLRVVDGRPELLPVVHHLDGYHRCDEMLRWLITHHLTGSALVEMIRFRGRSLLGLGSFVLSQLERAPERPVYLGRDLK